MSNLVGQFCLGFDLIFFVILCYVPLRALSFASSWIFYSSSFKLAIIPAFVLKSYKTRASSSSLPAFFREIGLYGTRPNIKKSDWSTIVIAGKEKMNLHKKLGELPLF